MTKGKLSKKHQSIRHKQRNKERQHAREKLINKMCLENLINNLNEREQKIIKLRYYNEKTQTEVAKILGITQVQVSRLEKKILLNMREKIS